MNRMMRLVSCYTCKYLHAIRHVDNHDFNMLISVTGPHVNLADTDSVEVGEFILFVIHNTSIL